MPKGTEYTITWSHARQAYELDHTPVVFSLTNESLCYWLRLIDAFHLETRTGYSLTARKERKKRGSAYWYAYKRVNGKLQKRYLGESSHITLTQLEDVAHSFVRAPEPKPHKQEQPQPPPRKPTFTFTRSLPSALSIFGFSDIPTKAVLIARYRALSKQHHPDIGGLHQDMVAINLAYDYLKRFVKH
jgi:hypothetical protein